MKQIIISPTKAIITIIALFFLYFNFSHSAFALDVEAVTEPSADIELSFGQPGKILEVLTKEGDVVEQGQLLARQDDEIEQIQLEILTDKAQNTIEIDMAELKMIQKKSDLKKMLGARKDGAVTQWEVEHIKLEADSSRLALKLAEFNKQQDELQRKSVVELISRLRLHSPIAGVIEEVTVEAGESLQALKPVMRVVNIDVVRIDVPVPIIDAALLSVDDNVSITYIGGDKIDGIIRSISSVGEAAAETLDVQIEAQNSLKRPVGERVTVSFDLPERNSEVTN